jgi:transcriptional regulator with XRE-family HTH domain
MSLNELKERLFKNKKFRDEYYKKDLAFEIGQMLLEARAEKGVTQEVLAVRIGTKQPSIARIENGASLPSLATLEKIAHALDSYLIPPVFGFMKNYPNKEVYPVESGAGVALNHLSVSTGFGAPGVYIFNPPQFKQESSAVYN